MPTAATISTSAWFTTHASAPGRTLKSHVAGYAAPALKPDRRGDPLHR